MAKITNHERVGKGMDLPCEGLQSFMELELGAAEGKGWRTEANQILSDAKQNAGPREIYVAAWLVLIS